MFENRQNKPIGIKIRTVVGACRMGRSGLSPSSGMKYEGGLGAPRSALGGSYTAPFTFKNSLNYELQVSALYYRYDIPSFRMQCGFPGPIPRHTYESDKVGGPLWGTALCLISS